MIYATLREVKEDIMEGISVKESLETAIKKLKLPETKVEYLKFCRADDLRELDRYNREIPSVLLAAVWWGDIRLIDNILV